jgi:hypothetical protein
MKWFLSVCALAGLTAALASSCGPERPFCPKNQGHTCYDTDGGNMGGQGGQDLGPCDGASVIICGDPAQTKVCKQSDCP